jgi:chromosomal replication initiation ATPase DnaA
MERTTDQNAWERVLTEVRTEVEPEDFRRWFGSTSYAGDSGDQITVWIGSESHRRHIETHFRDELDRALEAIERPHTQIRVVVAGFGDEEEEDEKEIIKPKL